MGPEYTDLLCTMYVRAILFILAFLPSVLLADTIRSSSVRVVGTKIYDEGQGTVGSDGTYFVDTRQDNCERDPDEEEDLEPFHDSIIGIRVVNNLNREIYFSRLRYRMQFQDESGNRVRVRVKRLGVSNGFVAPGNEEETEVVALLFEKKEDQKGIPKSDIIFPTDAGFRLIRFSLIGRTRDGDRVVVRSRFHLSLDNYYRCS